MWAHLPRARVRFASNAGWGRVLARAAGHVAREAREAREARRANAVDAGQGDVVSGESGRDGGGAPTLRGPLLEGELDVGASGGRLQGPHRVAVEVERFTRRTSTALQAAV